jgi:hypothetical protein
MLPDMTDHTYRLVIAEELDDERVRAFDGIAVSHDHGATVLVGPVSDKAQFYTLLRRVFKLGLTLQSAKLIADNEG